jgi:two-component system sensor histidine kinase DesK
MGSVRESILTAAPSDGWRGRRWRAGLGSTPWLGFPLADMLSAHPRPVRLALVIAALAVYIVAYWAMLFPVDDPPRGRRTAAIVTMLAIAVALTLADRRGWSDVMFTLAAVSIGLRVPQPPAERLVIACALLGAVSGAIAGADVPTTIVTFAQVAGIGALILAIARLRNANRELERARMEIARLAVADERLRFARDLHDLLGHSLSVIALKSELASRVLQRDPEAAAEHVRDVEHVARESLREVREAVSGYRRPTLAAELAAARLALEAAGIEIELEQRGGELPDEVESVLAWAVREAATNAARHSGARRCRVEVGVDGAAATLEVIDDGRGPAASTVEGGGSGLAGLAERVARAAGRLETGAGPGGGFRLRVVVPMVPAP